MSDIQYFKARVMFEKSKNAAYLSHLDLMKTFQRAFLRAKLKVRYSQGFNPHIYLSILSPISTGFSTKGDLFDLELLEAADYGDLVAKLNATLPDGLRIISAGPPKLKPADIGWSRYEIAYNSGDAAQMKGVFDTPCLIEKKSKRGSKTVDICDYINSISFDSANGGVLCRVTLKSGSEDPLNPVYITASLQEKGLLPKDCPAKYTRVSILDKNEEIFF